MNRLLHNKNIKAFYYLRNLMRYAMPRWILRRRLKGVLAQARKRSDWEYLCERADYYCKLQPGSVTPEGLRPLAEHRLPVDYNSVYFFDSYEFTRWFDDRLRWKLVPGDITKVPEVPAVVKSRPVEGNNANSVLLNLDKIRHFVFVRDTIPFREKQDRAIFRLSIGGRPHRERFVRMYFGSPICDVGIYPHRKQFPPEWFKPSISIYDHLSFKFVMAIEGNDVATNLKWVMSSNSLAVMPRPTYETWFMEGRLIPNYHYVEIRPDYSDLEERMRYYIEHPDQAEAIIAHAHEYVAQFWDRKREKLIALMVLDKYFAGTGQR